MEECGSDQSFKNFRSPVASHLLPSAEAFRRRCANRAGPAKDATEEKRSEIETYMLDAPTTHRTKLDIVPHDDAENADQ
jgi:hypothetical protein